MKTFVNKQSTHILFYHISNLLKEELRSENVISGAETCWHEPPFINRDGIENDKRDRHDENQWFFNLHELISFFMFATLWLRSTIISEELTKSQLS